MKLKVIIPSLKEKIINRNNNTDKSFRWVLVTVLFNDYFNRWFNDQVSCMISQSI